MTFHHDALNSNFPGINLFEFFQLQVIIAHIGFAKHACKGHTVSAENSL